MAPERVMQVEINHNIVTGRKTVRKWQFSLEINFLSLLID